jgi:SET domain-containing protein
MPKGRAVKRMFSLSPVEFRDSAIAGRGVFAKRRFEPSEPIVAYAPKHRRLPADDPEAERAAASKLTLLAADGLSVLLPDTTVPGGWLCNHSCSPNAALYSDGEGRIVCTRSIAPGEEVTIFYGWVTRNEPERDPCLCGSDGCRGFINFDVTDDDARNVEIVDGQIAATDPAVRRRLEAHGEFLRSIGQEHVQRTIANTLAAMKRG